MKTVALLFSAALCFTTALPAAAGAPGQLITLAQADVRIGPGGVSIGRDRDHDRDRSRVDEGREHGRDCRTVTVEENGRSRTTRECD